MDRCKDHSTIIMESENGETVFFFSVGTIRIRSNGELLNVIFMTCMQQADSSITFCIIVILYSRLLSIFRLML